MNEIDIKTLRSLLVYNPRTGKLTWKKRGIKNWDVRFAGKEAFTAKDGNGYRHGVILYKDYRAHRVAWAIQTGIWPKFLIDHKNGNKEDNRFLNLRPTNHRANGISARKKKKGATSKYLGVCFTANRWLAQIKTKNGTIYLGSFKKEKEAAMAYISAASFYHKTTLDEIRRSLEEDSS